jgi:hypothetical protein
VRRTTISNAKESGCPFSEIFRDPMTDSYVLLSRGDDCFLLRCMPKNPYFRTDVLRMGVNSGAAAVESRNTSYAVSKRYARDLSPTRDILGCCIILVVLLAAVSNLLVDG